MKLGYSEETGLEGDVIVLRMTRDDFNALLIAVGRATGGALIANDRAGVTSTLSLANRLNEGNPNWEPYGVSVEATRQ